ncbi:hypothetical protein [Desulforhopalus singaporensis]|uniref:Uncharacterized protein n=1 Tax=Desulforhopalus singaporensis TaxID=91360 RepID=A0A1H0LZ06_9BACT|nr:hypothetical protein [Desulforhopalus singaporensis]SDO73150.1 hypothetical protein SAMN05660330_00904 [Desulforhopalus singaporensis]
MRGTYEAFILVKVRDGRQFVCALNRRNWTRPQAQAFTLKQQREYLDKNVIWN